MLGWTREVPFLYQRPTTLALNLLSRPYFQLPLRLLLLEVPHTHIPPTSCVQVTDSADHLQYTTNMNHVVHLTLTEYYMLITPQQKWMRVFSTELVTLPQTSSSSSSVLSQCHH